MNKLHNSLLLLCILCGTLVSAQFNTVYSNRSKPVSTTTGNIFLDMPPPVQEPKTKPNTRITKLRRKVSNETDSIQANVPQPAPIHTEPKALPRTTPSEIKKPKETAPQIQYNPYDQEAETAEEVIYKTLPLIDTAPKKTITKQSVYMPLRSLSVSSKFGVRIHPVTGGYKMHNGVDFRASYELVYSVLPGYVLTTGYTSINGNYIVVQHQGGYQTYYLHLSKIAVKPFQQLNAGSIMALSGNTGRSTGPHLHFSVKEDGKFIDPIKFLNDLIITNNTLATYGNQRSNSQKQFN